MVPRKNGPRKNGPREKWSPKNWFPEKWSLEKWSSENWSPEKCPSKIVLRQQNARKFKRLFHFYQLIPLYTQKDVLRLRHDPTCAPNRRTLKESRKICCRVLGFHRFIDSWIDSGIQIIQKGRVGSLGTFFSFHLFLASR